MNEWCISAVATEGPERSVMPS